MRNRLFAAAVALIVIGSAPPAGAQAGGRGASAALVPPPLADTSMSGVNAEARAIAQADSLRRAVLGYATYAGFGDPTCASYDMRTFEKDANRTVPRLLSQLEMLVLSYGVNASLDNDTGRGLVRTLVRLEGGGPGPRWDVLTGDSPRSFNPVLPAKMLRVDTKECINTPGLEPDGIILPEMTGFVVPRDSGALNFTVGYGPLAVNELRNFFFSRHMKDSAAVLDMTRVTAYGMWGDYAIMGVLREKEYKGFMPMEKETTGAVYAFHRVGGEWRLLALVRNW